MQLPLPFILGQKLIIKSDFMTREITVSVEAPVVTFTLEVHCTHACSFQASLRMNGCVVVVVFHQLTAIRFRIVNN